jgi:tetratricopeptide (TPR) repeat protein
MDDLQGYNEPHLEQLVELLEAGNGAGLVGAGTSIACGYPGWQEFLASLEAPLARKWLPEYLKEVRARDVRTRLDEMILGLGQEYPRIFQKTFCPRGDGRDTPEWIRLLFDLNLPLLMTTNYTQELEDAARFHPSVPLGTSPNAVRWHEAKRLYEALHRSTGRHQLIYLHGRWDDSPERQLDAHGRPWSKVILGEESYRYAYEHPGDVASTLEMVCGTKTLLILGSSLQDEDMVGVARAAQATAGPLAYPHYAVLPLSPQADPPSRAADLRARFGIQPIFYPVFAREDGKEDHGALEELLRQIVNRVAHRTRKQNKRVEIRVSAGEVPPRPRIVYPLLRAEDFEPRPQLQNPLEEFLVRSQGGVLALIGIGGAGKTALVQEAVARLLAGDLVPEYDALFVWSFYDNPSVVAFFGSLAGYLRAEELPEAWNEARLYEVFRSCCRSELRLLIVLDGLERLQLERADDRRVHGTLESPVLRRFLLWLAQVPGATRAIVTSRFPLPDLAGEEGRDRCLVLDLDALTRPQARSLLRRRGVALGTEADLDLLLDHFGAHALTVDHLGGVIATYLDGDPMRFRELGKGPLTRFEAGQAGKRLARVLSAYLGYLTRDEPQVRETLERVAVFSRPVGSGLLAKIFLAPGREERAGGLARAREVDLRRFLKRLTELRFLREEAKDHEVVYSLHPALRQVVLEALGENWRNLADAARAGFEEDLDLIAGDPDRHPSHPAALDFIEDLIGFCVESGELERAFELYSNRLGGYKHLGWILGDYARGERLARRLVEAPQSNAVLSRGRFATLVTTLALNLKSLGRLQEAAGFLEAQAGLFRTLGYARDLSIDLCDLAEVQILAGQNVAAEATAYEALAAAEDEEDDQSRRDSHLWIAVSRGARGDLQKALLEYFSCLQYQQILDGRQGILYSRQGFQFQLLLLYLRRAQEALDLSEIGQEIHERNDWQDDIARSHLIQAEALRQLGRTRSARGPLNRAREWALAAGEQEILLWSRLFAARLLRDCDRAEEARSEAEEGLRSAEAMGFNHFQVDFCNLLAELWLWFSTDLERALMFATKALESADDPACDYFWGRLDACLLLELIHEALGRPELVLAIRRRAESLKNRLDVPAHLVSTLLSHNFDPSRAPNLPH